MAQRLRADGLRVWFDEWEMKAGDSIPAKIAEGLDRSRVLVLCMSANAFGSDWTQLETGMFQFRDPLNKERRFIPLRLDDTPIKAILAQFMYINWCSADRNQEYAKLLEACQPPVRPEMEADRQLEKQQANHQENRRSQRKKKVPVLNWRASLELVERQFETTAEQSHGLHHLLVETSDDERARLAGPDWFARLSLLNQGKEGTAPIEGPWPLVACAGLPDVPLSFRELVPGKPINGFQDEQIIRDNSGVPRAVAVPMRPRWGYLCGDGSWLSKFELLAKAASQVLTDEPELVNHPFAEDLCDLFRKPRGGVRYVFGDVPSSPLQFMARGWNAGILAFQNGVLIDMPITEEFPGVGHWLLLLHRLSWRKHSGCPLTGARIAWHGNVTVPYEWVSEPESIQRLPTEVRNSFAGISGKSYYSILGERDRPLDVNLASVFAIRLILSAADG